MKRIELKERLIISELGMTHDGSFGQAKSMIKASADCGVDAVKLQMHISEEETVKDAPQPPYFNAEPRYEYFERTAFSMEKWMQLKEYAHSLGLYFIVSPFSIAACKHLVDLGVDAIKIPSGEVTNVPYLEYLSHIDIPIIVSSGMSSIDELAECMDILMSQKDNIGLMQCTSEYPCTPEHIGLNVIDEFREKYPSIPIGFSDHSAGEWAAIAAFMKGAKIVEKHFTLSKLMYGPDAAVSMDPCEMKQLCESIKNLEKAIDSPVDKEDCLKYGSMKNVFQKSIVASRNLSAGTILTADMLAYKKPGDGVETKYYKKLIGKTLSRNMKKDEKFVMEDLQ